MSIASLTTTPASLFRVGKFVVPAAAMPAFVARTQRVKQVLDRCSGCKQNLVLTQTGAAGELNVVTIVEWESAEALMNANAAVNDMHAQEGFNPEAFRNELGIRADVAMYHAANG